MKPNKQNIINDILIELEKGISYTDCLVLNGSRWFKPKTSFTRLWKEANEQYRNKQESINKELLSIDIENKKQVLKSTLLDKIDRILIAEEIALKNGAKVTVGDQLKALDYLSKIHGDYAPQKVESETNVNFRPRIDFD